MLAPSHVVCCRRRPTKDIHFGSLARRHSLLQGSWPGCAVEGWKPFQFPQDVFPGAAGSDDTRTGHLAGSGEFRITHDNPAVVEAWDGGQSPVNARQLGIDIELSLPERSPETVKE